MFLQAYVDTYNEAWPKLSSMLRDVAATPLSATLTQFLNDVQVTSCGLFVAFTPALHNLPFKCIGVCTHTHTHTHAHTLMHSHPAPPVPDTRALVACRHDICRATCGAHYSCPRRPRCVRVTSLGEDVAPDCAQHTEAARVRLQNDLLCNHMGMGNPPAHQHLGIVSH